MGSVGFHNKHKNRNPSRYQITRHADERITYRIIRQPAWPRYQRTRDGPDTLAA